MGFLHEQEIVADNTKRQNWIDLFDPVTINNSPNVLFDYAVFRGLTLYVKDQMEAGFLFEEHPPRDILCLHLQREGSLERVELLDAYKKRIPFNEVNFGRLFKLKAILKKLWKK